jgi:hypothetical protein
VGILDNLVKKWLSYSGMSYVGGIQVVYKFKKEWTNLFKQQATKSINIETFLFG